ncbi:MAG TPA: hypothetical protein VJC18_04050 [bacterium]|nr:hypothetical protein [bacterium]
MNKHVVNVMGLFLLVLCLYGSNAVALYIEVQARTYTQVSAGDRHSCGLADDGSVWCWGQGNDGKLGNGDVVDQDQPVQVINSSGNVMKDFKQVSAGSFHTCALRADTSVWCWGAGEDGQMGNGDSSNQISPVQVMNSDGRAMKGFSLISAGNDHTCGVRNNSTIWCWGNNRYGQIGNKANTDVYIATQVVNELGKVNKGFVQVSAGAYHSCALKDDRSVWCWGYGDFGQLGNGGEVSSNVPVAVVEISDIKVKITDFDAVSAGGYHTCALKADSGSLWCWGMGNNGQLGNGQIAHQASPVRVVSASHQKMADFIDVSAGEYHTCGMTSDDAVWCWGQGDSGQLGNGNTDDVNGAVLVLENDENTEIGFGQLSVGGEHTCGFKDEGSIWCWGLGREGQLGNADVSNHSTPVQVQ